MKIKDLFGGHKLIPEFQNYLEGYFAGTIDATDYENQLNNIKNYINESGLKDNELLFLDPKFKELYNKGGYDKLANKKYALLRAFIKYNTADKSPEDAYETIQSMYNNYQSSLSHEEQLDDIRDKYGDLFEDFFS